MEVAAAGDEQTVRLRHGEGVGSLRRCVVTAEGFYPVNAEIDDAAQKMFLSFQIDIRVRQHGQTAIFMNDIDDVAYIGIIHFCKTGFSL